MSEESAQFHAAAKQSDTGSDEAWERMQRLSQRTDWDVERMLPEIFDECESSSTAGSSDEFSPW